MASKWKLTERIPLSTKALDQAGRSYDVELRMDGGHWVVALLGTPGSWRFETIKDAPAFLAISGFSWGWTNAAPSADHCRGERDYRCTRGDDGDEKVFCTVRSRDRRCAGSSPRERMTLVLGT
jgi:hypothetical protein